MTYQHLEIERSGGVATLWLNRPEKLNAMSEDMWSDIPEAMRELDGDGDVRVVIVAGRGSAFTVGIDLRMLASLQPDGASHADKSRRTYEIITRLQQTNTSIADSPKPTIAAIHGYCLGEGMSLISACDIRLASAEAVFSIRETRMGLVADVGVLQRLPAIVGSGHAAELALTGSDIGADRAHQIGLVNRVFDEPSDLLAGAFQLAESIAANSPLVMSGVKKVLAANRNRTTEQALDFVAQWNSANLFSNDLYEAISAFTGKRDPEFKGT